MTSPTGRRLVRGLAVALLLLWAVDRSIYAVTEYAWWASLGFTEALRDRWAAQAQVTLVALASCLLLTALALPVALAENKEAPPLPRALRFVNALRVSVPGWAWALLIVGACLLTRRLVSFWPDWLRLWSHSRWNYAVPYYGLPADFWICRLPFLEQYLLLLWRFSWLLFAVTAAAGLVNALPLLAARRPRTPTRYLAVVWRLGAWLLVLRAAGYGLEFFTIAYRQFDASGLFLQRPAAVLGAAFCLALAANCAGRIPSRRPGRRFWQGVALALLGPLVLRLALGPAVNWATPDAGILQARAKCTQFAWNLQTVELPAPSGPRNPAEAWTPWDESRLLELMQSTTHQDRPLAKPGPESRRLYSWRSCGLEHFPGEGWRAIVAGQPADLDDWNTRQEAEIDNAIGLQELPLPAMSTHGPQPLMLATTTPAFFGLEGPALVAQKGKDGLRGIGVPLDTWPWKLAWAWRLRDLFMLPQAKDGDSLFVYQGLQERVFRLAPFLTPTDEPRPVWSDGHLQWVQSYTASTPYAPASSSDWAGPFGSATAAGDTVKVEMDAETGTLEFKTAITNSGPATIPWEMPLRELVLSRQSPQTQYPYPRFLLETQARVTAKLSGGNVLTEPAIVAAPNPEPSLCVEDSKGNWQLLQGDGNEFPGRLVAWKNILSVGDRLADLDKARNDSLRAEAYTTPKGFQAISGPPAIWRDARAPGGWWFARAYFEIPQVTVHGPDAGQPQLIRVAITAATGPVGVDRDLDSAWKQLQEKNPGLMLPPLHPGKNPLIPEAIDLHNRALQAFKAGKYDEFGDYMRRELDILERMAQ